MITLVIEQLVGHPRFLRAGLLRRRLGIEVKAVMDNTPVARVLEILSRDSRIGVVVVDSSCGYSSEEIRQILNTSKERGIKTAFLHTSSEKPALDLPFDAVLPMTEDYKEVKNFVGQP